MRRWWRRQDGPEAEASCREVGKVLQAWLDGHVDDVTAGRVRRHLEDCRRCGLEASTYSEIKAALARRAPDLDDAAVERLQEFGQRLLEGPAGDSDTGEPAS